MRSMRGWRCQSRRGGGDDSADITESIVDDPVLVFVVAVSVLYSNADDDGVDVMLALV